jgi:hypothetical protein
VGPFSLSKEALGITFFVLISMLEDLLVFN